jgi:predicted O-methyltransferase YrrM
VDDAAAQTDARRLLAPEDDALLAARTRSGPADEVPSPEVGALLAWVARGIDAGTAVEVGSAAGISGLWLLEGLTGRGVLTSVEPDAHRHGLASQAYAEAGVTSRVRAIEGDPAAVLPRLADGAYDLVLLQTSVDPAHLDHALRLARPGGVIILRGTLQEGARAVVRGLVGDTEQSVLERLAEADTVDATVLPIDDGLVLARRLAD